MRTPQQRRCPGQVEAIVNTGVEKGAAGQLDKISGVGGTRAAMGEVQGQCQAVHARSGILLRKAEQPTGPADGAPLSAGAG